MENPFEALHQKIDYVSKGLAALHHSLNKLEERIANSKAPRIDPHQCACSNAHRPRKDTVSLNPNLPVAALTQAEFQDMLRGFIEQFPSPQPNPTVAETKLLSVAEMCALAKISRGTLYTARKEGRIPFKRIGKRILFSPSEVLEALKQG